MPLEEFDTSIPGMKLLVVNGSLQFYPVPFPHVYVRKDFLKRYTSIRQQFPDVYPPLDFELNIIHLAKTWLVKYAQELQDSGYYTNLVDCSNKLKIELLVFYLQVSTIQYDSLETYESWLKPETPTLEGKLLYEILELYRNAGYTYRYFMFYNAKSPLVQCSLNTIAITPDIFEAGVGIFPVENYPEQWEKLAKYRTAPEFNNRYDPSDVPVGAAPFTTWTKISIVNAIINSGLTVPVRPGQRRPGTKNIAVRRASVKLPPLERGPYREYMSLNLENTDPAVRCKIDDSWVYITLYRKLMGTLDYINWTNVFMRGLLPDAKLPLLAREYGLGENVSRPELKSRIIEIGTKRSQMAQQIAELLPLQSQAIIYQPNSAWLKPVTRYQFSESGMTLTHPYEQFVFIKELCSNENVDKEVMLRKLEVAGMRLLIPNGLEEYSKADLCAYLLEHIGRQASQFENLFFACADPDITIQSILNTLRVMELEGITKDLDLETITKDNLCTVINNYLRLLLEAKARSVATF